MIILGIDTSCDDTGVGIVEDGHKIHANIIASQHLSHERWGGIVPMIAARQHVQNINPVLEAALKQAQMSYDDLDAIAVSNDQGLLLSLVVGVSAAKSVAIATGLPLIGIHHLEGHIYSVMMEHMDSLSFPFLCLTVAGGHTLILKVTDHSRYELLGHTRDDAAGEAYDKIARRLDLGYPGGPIIDKLASDGNPKAFRFPRPLMKHASEFSFSGLKTAVIRAIEKLEAEGAEIPVADICASFQAAVVDMLVSKAFRLAETHQLQRIALAGGVAMNSLLRKTLEEDGGKRGYQTFAPARGLCVDNGAMVAGAAYWIYGRSGFSSLNIGARANAPLGLNQLKYKHDSKYR